MFFEFWVSDRSCCNLSGLDRKAKSIEGIPRATSAAWDQPGKDTVSIGSTNCKERIKRIDLHAQLSSRAPSASMKYQWTLAKRPNAVPQSSSPGTVALTGPPPINIDFRNDAIGGSASNALFCQSVFTYPVPMHSLSRNPKTFRSM